MAPRSPGIASTVPIAERPVHWSDLRWIGRSPAHYRAALTNRSKPTAAMQLGTLTHAIVLGGSYLVWPGDRRGKAWEEFRDANAGQDIFTAAEVEKAKAMALAVERHPMASRLVKEARHEVPASWRYMGRACETGGIDLLAPGRLSELKTASDARPERFGWHAKSMGYLGQLAWYEQAAISLNCPAEEFRIIAVETRPPFDVVVHRITPSAIEGGRMMVRSLMERLAVCEASDMWPGYCDDEVALDTDSDAELIFDEEAA